MLTEDCRLSVDALVRSLAVNSGRPVCLLLGAGASITSGMPSAERCIWEWKQDIFVTNNPMLRQTVGELSLPGTRSRIQRWLDQRGKYPTEGDTNEYSFYAQECYPTGQDRRAYFQGYSAKAQPHSGYRLLPLLARERLIKSIWTTNFDGLVPRACAAANVVCIEVGIDSQNRVNRPHSEGELRVVSMHGDFRYDELKNTATELQQQEISLRDEFLHELQDHDLIVLGYSGRDASIMTVLHQAYSKGSKCRLFWCGYGENVAPNVEDLIVRSRASGVETFYAASEGFDDLIARWTLRQFNGEALERARSILQGATGSSEALVSFSVPPAPVTALIKSNAYPLSFPTQTIKVGIDLPADANRRDWLKERMLKMEGTAVWMNDGLVAIAKMEDLQKAFGPSIRGNSVSHAISELDLERDGRIQSLVRRSLVRHLSASIGVPTDFNRRIWDATSYREHTLKEIRYKIHRALSIRLETIDGKPYVALMPEVMATKPDGTLADIDVAKLVRTAIYGYQHNDVFDADLKHWTDKITEMEISAYGGQFFRITRAPLYAGLSEKSRAELPVEMSRHARQKGIVISDANLLFSSSNGKFEVKNTNPLKGLVENKPWDYQLTTSGLSPSIELAAICPASDSGKLKRFIAEFQERSQPAQSERDYLQEFPGFSKAFGLPLIASLPGEPTWIDLNDGVSGDVPSRSRQIAARLCKGLDVIRSIRPGTIVAIFIPTRWAEYEKVEDDSGHFDLHHFLKAYAARHGQSTQFIRERTTITPQPCRVRWWLSLALYAKALRTPWRLDCLDDNTAFVGIGYSIDPDAMRGNHVLLGCSHMYNARGEGLQFRLGRIEDPIIRGRNAFMSLDDARRTGETIRQLFFDAKMRLPTRVVVHKRTQFTKEEQLGLLQGMEGVPNVELIEVTIEESFRYLASKMTNGKLEIDKFPIPRGAIVLLDKSSALLWVHGVTPNAMNPQWKYYQGKRRIPTPLLVRRYRGQSDIVQVGTELLGLSKMNWNTFDYYSRLPATLDSAAAIAKLGGYLSGFHSAPYDYRLLI